MNAQYVCDSMQKICIAALLLDQQLRGHTDDFVKQEIEVMRRDTVPTLRNKANALFRVLGDEQVDKVVTMSNRIQLVGQTGILFVVPTKPAGT